MGMWYKIFIGYSLFCVWALAWLSSYLVHISMVREETDVWKMGTFFSFLKEFRKKNWERIETLFPKSYFDRRSNSEIHASIIKFDGVGMILDPISWTPFCILMFIDRYRKPKKTFSAFKGFWK